MRKPSVEEPLWLTRLKAGDPAEMDKFLETAGLGLRQMAGLPDPNELLEDAPYDYRSSKEVKSDRGRIHNRRCKKSVLYEQPAPVETAPTGCGAASPGGRVAPHDEKELQFQVGGAKSSTNAGKDTSVDLSQCDGYDWRVLLRLFRRSQFVFSKKFLNLEAALQSGPGLLDLFSGARGFSKCFTQTAGSWSVCFDLKHHEDENLLDPELQRILLQLINKGFFRAMASSPVCASFSTAITPPWRTLAFPAGRPDITEEQRAKIQIGQDQLRFTIALVRACLVCKVVFWIENPATSWFWKQQDELSWDGILTNPGVAFLTVDQCRFGTPWRKRAKFLTNSHVRNQKVSCTCLRPHTVLRGRCKSRKVNYTKLAEAYPRALCSVLGSAIAIDVGAFADRRRLDVGACAKAAPILESYGYEQFRAGFPLHYYRQLAAHIQKEFPLVRPYMSIAWCVVNKWEHFEPVQHRTPMPEPLLRAMCSLALLWKWKRVAAMLLLTFYSISRIGEVLRAAREDLLTPRDLLSERQVLYLKIRNPKSRGRGPKTQYSSCDEPEVVAFISAVFARTPSSEALYPSSASAFRRRFDALLKFLSIEKKHRVTPGSLRGGGAVWGHRQKIPIDELCWKMRLQHTKTLRYYLQEVAAESILPSVNDDSRQMILLLQGLLPPLLQEFASD